MREAFNFTANWEFVLGDSSHEYVLGLASSPLVFYQGHNFQVNNMRKVQTLEISSVIEMRTFGIFLQLALTVKIPLIMYCNSSSDEQQETNYGDFRRVVGKRQGVSPMVNFRRKNQIFHENPGNRQLCEIWNNLVGEWSLGRRLGQSQIRAKDQPSAYTQLLSPKSAWEEKWASDMETDLLEDALTGSPQQFLNWSRVIVLFYSYNIDVMMQHIERERYCFK